VPVPVPQFLAGEVIPAAKLQMLGNHGATWTPTLTATTTNPTLGTSPTQTSLVWLNGQHVTLWFQITFGSGAPTAGSGNYTIPLPAQYPALSGHIESTLGTVRLVDTSTGAVRLAIATLNLAAQGITMRTTSDNAVVTNSAPWTWAAGDVIAGTISYLTSFGG